MTRPPQRCYRRRHDPHASFACFNGLLDRPPARRRGRPRRTRRPLVEALEGPHARQAIAPSAVSSVPSSRPRSFAFFSSAEPDLRIEAATALAQMKADTPLSAFLEKERDPRVRAVLYESIGRLPKGRGDAPSRPSRRRGGPSRRDERSRVALSSARGRRRSDSALAAIRRATRESRSSAVRQLGLLALNRAGIAIAKPWRAPSEIPIPGSPAGRHGVERVARQSVSSRPLRSAPSGRELRPRGGRPTGPERARRPSRHRPPGKRLRFGAARTNRWRRTPDGAARRALSFPSRRSRPTPLAASFRGSFPIRCGKRGRMRRGPRKSSASDGALEKLRSDRHPNVVAEALRTPEEALSRPRERRLRPPDDSARDSERKERARRRRQPS